jgi:hypothetical protein
MPQTFKSAEVVLSGASRESLLYAWMAACECIGVILRAFRVLNRRGTSGLILSSLHITSMDKNRSLETILRTVQSVFLRRGGQFLVFLYTPEVVYWLPDLSLYAFGLVVRFIWGLMLLLLAAALSIFAVCKKVMLGARDFLLRTCYRVAVAIDVNATRACVEALLRMYALLRRAFSGVCVPVKQVQCHVTTHQQTC